jgi:hypothetical protein
MNIRSRLTRLLLRFRHSSTYAKVAIVTGVLAAITWGIALADVAEDSLLEPALRVERVTRLAQTYRAAPGGALICLPLATTPQIDGDLSDWPEARTGTVLAIGAPTEPAEGTVQTLHATIRTAWSPTGLYISADIHDPAIMPGTAPEDIRSGGTFQATFQTALAGKAASEETAEDNATAFIISNTSKGPVVSKATDKMRQLIGDKLAAIVDTQGRRVIEVCLPWSEIKPIEPHGNTATWFSVRLEGHEADTAAESPSLDTSGEQTRLIFAPASATATPTGYLSVVADAVTLGDPVDGTLIIESPKPYTNVALRFGVEAIADDKTRSVTHLTQDLRLERGLNVFKLRWDSSDNTAGDYAIQATASNESQELFALRAPIKVSPPQNAAIILGKYSATLSNKATLARITKARETDPAAPLKFAVMGDPRDGDAIFQKALVDAAEDGAQFALVLGDLVSSGRPGQYIQLAKILEKAPLPVLVTAGNHDYGNGGRTYYQRLFGNASYAFDLDRYHFIVLDNGDGQLTTARLSWLENELKSSLPKIVFTHEPPSTIEKWAWHSFSSGTERFTALMEQYKPLRVYVSHIHAYDRVTQNGIEYVLTGGAGAPLYDQLGKSAAIHNYIMVNAGAEGLTDELVKLGWQRVTQAGK